MSEKESTDKILLKKVREATDQALLEMLEDLRKEGNANIVPELIGRWKNSQGALSEKLLEFLSDMRSQEALPHVMDAIQAADDNTQRNQLLSVLWMSSLDASDQIEELVDIALDGDFVTAVEVSTVIESFDSEFQEDVIMDLMYRIDEKLMDEEDAEFIGILQSLKEVVNKLNVA